MSPARLEVKLSLDGAFDIFFNLEIVSHSFISDVQKRNMKNVLELEIRENFIMENENKTVDLTHSTFFASRFTDIFKLDFVEKSFDSHPYVSFLLRREPFKCWQARH